MDKLIEDRAGQLTIVTDGYTNINNDAQVNYLAVARDSAIFLKTVATGKDRHTGEYISDGLQEVIGDIGREKIVAVTTDNASAMRSSWDLIKRQHPDLLTFGCGSHTTKLLVDDIFKIQLISKTFNQIKEVVLYFKVSSLRYAHLKETADEMSPPHKFKALQLPGKTRWQGRHNTVDRLLHNRKVLEFAIMNKQALLPIRPTAGDRAKFEEVKQLIVSDEFWERTGQLRDLLEPCLKVNIALEADESKSSRLYAWWTWLLAESMRNPMVEREEGKHRDNTLQHSEFL